MIKRKINPQLLSSYSDDISSFLKPIYAARNIKEDDLNLSLKNLLKPDFADLEKALKILTQAILTNKNILIIGDFDADGATSCALAVKALRSFSHSYVDFLVPNRFIHGYGLSPEIVEVAKAEKNPDIIITVDNGISSFAGVELAKKYNIQVIITDHHLPNDKLPNADAIINPNLKDCNFPSKNLAGVGVSFYLFSALKTHLQQQGYFKKNNIAVPDMRSLLDLVALGTVADVVPLDKNNRILVNEGLKIIRSEKCSIGILALIKVAKKVKEFIKSSDLGFAIAPRINASGRMDDISRGINCLLSIDFNSALIYANELDEFNKNRKNVQEQMSDKAEEILKSQKIEDKNFAISLYDKSWHEGVVGIVAGKIKESYNRPSVVFAGTKDNLKGSARSIPSVHIKDLLDLIDRKNPDLILKFGGHAMAAGLSISLDNFEKFSYEFNQATKKYLNNQLPTMEILTDGELIVGDINIKNAKILEQHIWGNNFEEPLFYNNFIIKEQRVVGEKHLKLRLEIDNLVFNAMAFFTAKITTNKVKIFYKLSVNNYMNNEFLQLIIEGIDEG